jgi:diguanylate cyclase (GGDEF)-like protein
MSESATTAGISSLPKGRYSLARVGFMLLLVLGSLTTLLGIDLVRSYENQYEVVSRDGSNLTGILEHHIKASTEKIDVVLREVVFDYTPVVTGATKRAVLTVNQDLLRREAFIPEAQANSLRIINAEGLVIFSAGETEVLPNVNVSDRNYFIKQKSNPNAGLVLSEPILSKFTQRWLFTLSRRISNPDGSFAGLIQTAMRADYFQSSFKDIDVGPRGNISLFTDDFRLVARYPALDHQLGKTFDLKEVENGLSQHQLTGTYKAVSRIDNALRAFSYRKINTLPLVVFIGVSPDDFLKSWIGKAWIYAISLLVLSLEVVALIYVQRKISRENVLLLEQKVAERTQELGYTNQKLELAVHAAQQQATHDALTGLPNRAFLEKRIVQAIARAKRKQSMVGVIFLDLDDFKAINDHFGHDHGDILLQQLASFLQNNVRASDTVIRFGGDEFVILVDDAPLASDVIAVVEHIFSCLRQTIQIGPYQAYVTGSCGIALYPQDGENYLTLIKHADTAMYRAKELGRNRFCLYDAEMSAQLATEAKVREELRLAIDDGQLTLHYQPQVEAESRRIVGAEALVRWQHPIRGMVSPAEFIPLAEKTGLILPLGNWVLNTACAQLAQWAKRPEFAHIMLAVNVSPHQFQDVNFVEYVINALRSNGANPSYLKLELTESLLVANVEEVITKMNTLQSIGVRFSLDDFGTGYSSLAYLSRLPLDQLKIDRSFVINIETNERDALICAATISLAHSLGLKVVAEGVETEAQRFFLNSGHDCDFIQGYLISRPIPVEAFEEIVVSGALS